MPAPPKPEKRPRKKPKPLKRSPLKRSTTRIARVSKSPRRQAEVKADRAWSEAVKAKGPCVAKFAEELHGIECVELIDPAHIYSRDFDATRHDVENGVPLCRNAHDWFGAHPIAWEAFVRRLIGDEKYEALGRKARAGLKR